MKEKLIDLLYEAEGLVNNELPTMEEEQKKAEMGMDERRTDFRIISRPVEITFVCPHCEVSQEISWRDIDIPEYWGDDWGEVECPTCGEMVELGDYEYD